MRRALVGATLALLRALANSRDPASLSTTVYAIRSHPSRMEVVKLHGNHVLWWIYRASSRIVSLFSDTGSPRSAVDRLNADPFELVFVTNTQSDVGSALTTAVKALVELSLSGPLYPVIQSNFSAIMRHAFEQGRQPHDGTSGPPKPGDFGIIDYFVASGGLTALPLDSSLDATLRRDILEPALKYLAMALYESRPQSIEEERMIEAPTSDHGFRAKRLLLELRSQCQKFLHRLAKGLVQKTYLPCTVPRANSEPLLHAIRIHGYLAHHCTRLSATRDPSSGIAMLQFLSPLVAEDIMDHVPDVAVRRHAWGSIGSFVSLYATPIGRLCEERDLERFFHFEDFTAETIAVGLIRALRLVDIENDVFRKSHCKHCCLKPHEFFQLLLHLTGSSQADYWTVFGGIVTMALRAIVGLWDKKDQEALQVKRSLYRHDFVSHLPACLALQGEPGDIAQALQAKLDRTPEHEVVEVEAVPETDGEPRTDQLLGTMGEWVHSLLVSRVLG
ncbi:hypothetical protein NUW54_g1 [Trametes sanguinea]|uniref:Uncharacterized protein n=1 Tax=Trametes sanguinea TaxID=158606 RepID=A0ACC1QBR8_9APHY|nr:hypothetical protein NUW54_g1 [Trametes sanguinea]